MDTSYSQQLPLIHQCICCNFCQKFKKKLIETLNVILHFVQCKIIQKRNSLKQILIVCNGRLVDLLDLPNASQGALQYRRPCASEKMNPQYSPTDFKAFVTPKVLNFIKHSTKFFFSKASTFGYQTLLTILQKIKFYDILFSLLALK